MPLTYEIDRSKDLTIFTAAGEVTYNEFLNAVDSYIKAGPTRYEILDCLNSTGWETVTFEQIKQVIQREASRSSRNNWQTAIVVSSNIGLTLTRIYQGMTEVETTPQQAKVFRSLEDAYLWLNIPQEESGK